MFSYREIIKFSFKCQYNIPFAQMSRAYPEQPRGKWHFGYEFWQLGQIKLE